MNSSISHVTKETIHRLTYYEIFSLESATQEIDMDFVRRAYRRLVLLFHPDKDPSPGAREAFERVALALQTLTDPQLRREYDDELSRLSRREEPHAGGTLSARRRQQMEEEARMADMILRQKEAATAAKAAATREEEKEKEAAAKQMLHELTSVLTTPFKRMEAELVHEWDVNEELLEMKEREVELLLKKLSEYNDDNDIRERREGAANVSRAKRLRDGIVAGDGI